MARATVKSNLRTRVRMNPTLAPELYCPLTNLQSVVDQITALDCKVELIPSSELPTDIQLPTDVLGMAGGFTSGAIHSCLKQRGRSADCSEYVVLNTSPIEAWSRELADACNKDFTIVHDRVLLSLALHELAHVFERPPLPEPTSRTQASNLPTHSYRAIEQFLGSEDERQSKPKLPHSMHGLTFVRTLVHVVYRWRNNYPLAAVQPFQDILLASQTYHLSPLPLYVDTMGDEPYRYRKRPLSSIRLVNPPEECCELFRSDFEHWLKVHQQN